MARVWFVVSELDVASLLRKDGIKSIGHSYVWKAVDQMYTYGYHWNITCRVCVPAVWLGIEGGMRAGCGCFHPKFFDIWGMGQKYLVLVWHSMTIQWGYFFFPPLLWGSLRFRFSFF